VILLCFGVVICCHAIKKIKNKNKIKNIEIKDKNKKYKNKK
jgi:hypothetical protein